MKRSRSRSSSISTSTESNLKKQKSHKCTASKSSEKKSKNKRQDGVTKHGKGNSSGTATAGPSEDARIKRKKKKKHKKLKKEKRPGDKTTKNQSTEECLNVPVELMDKSKSYAPMTKEEWDKQQSVVRKVYDEASGRYRLIKGEGEVIEEMVSKDKHMAINEQATKGDGIYFQAQLSQQK